uniref:Uncharacterized protein n=1 Tax=Ciona savignyi TaxID=51511 RepID=H2ZN88_CIOSA
MITNMEIDSKCKTTCADTKQGEKKTFQDLDTIVQEILFWEKTIFNLQQENSDLRTKMGSLENTVARLQSFCDSGNETNVRMKETVVSLQNLLETKLDQEDEIRSMRCQVINLEQLSNLKEVKLNQETEENKSKVDALLTQHRIELEKLRKDFSVKSECRESEMQAQIDKLSNQLKEQQTKFSDTEKLNGTKMIKLQIEYENKIAMLQAQMSRLHSNAPSHANNNDIFRRKLQHIQEGAANEIERLKKEIKSLREEQSARHQIGMGYRPNPNTVAVQPRPGILKKRKY